MFIDFQALKEQVAVEDVATMLGLSTASSEPAGERWRGPCPRCKKGGDRALVVTPGKGYYCFADNKGGDAIALAAHVLNVPMKEAALRIAEFFDLLPDKNEPSREATSTQKKTALEPLTYLLYEHEAVQALGIDPQTAEALGIGYAKKGIMRGRVAIPLRAGDGTLSGYCGYNESAEPKLKFPPTLILT